MHLISIADLSVEDIGDILDMAEDLKEKRKAGVSTDYLKQIVAPPACVRHSKQQIVNRDTGLCGKHLCLPE